MILKLIKYNKYSLRKINKLKISKNVNGFIQFCDIIFIE